MTIKDIARISGVSVSTVSRVLNDHPDVSPACREKVLAVIRESNYIPNNSARDLVRTNSDAIGLVIRGISNPFYTDIIHAIEGEIERRGYTMVMQQIADCDDEIKCGAVMEREKRLRGIVFLGGSFDYKPLDIRLLNVPFVCCSYSNQYGTLQPNEYSSVSIEDRETARAATEYLIERGHRRIAALVSRKDDCSISQLRYQGYCEALRQYGITPDDTLIISAETFDIHGAYCAMAEKLRQNADFSAVFAISDNMALGAMRALREAGKKVPDNCSVIAIDGLEVSDYVYPPLTTLCQPTAEMGRRSAQLLLDIIEGKGKNQQECLPTSLRVGASVKARNES